MFKWIANKLRERVEAHAKKDAFAKIRSDLVSWGYPIAEFAADEQLVEMCEQIGRALKQCKNGLQLRNLRRRVEQGKFKFNF